MHVKLANVLKAADNALTAQNRANRNAVTPPNKKPNINTNDQGMFGTLSKDFNRFGKNLSEGWNNTMNAPAGQGWNTAWNSIKKTVTESPWTSAGVAAPVAIGAGTYLMNRVLSAGDQQPSGNTRPDESGRPGNMGWLLGGLLGAGMGVGGALLWNRYGDAIKQGIPLVQTYMNMTPGQRKLIGTLGDAYQKGGVLGAVKAAWQDTDTRSAVKNSVAGMVGRGAGEVVGKVKNTLANPWATVRNGVNSIFE